MIKNTLLALVAVSALAGAAAPAFADSIVRQDSNGDAYAYGSDSLKKTAGEHKATGSRWDIRSVESLVVKKDSENTDK
jgi:hypothetical protein